MKLKKATKANMEIMIVLKSLLGTIFSQWIQISSQEAVPIVVLPGFASHSDSHGSVSSSCSGNSARKNIIKNKACFNGLLDGLK